MFSTIVTFANFDIVRVMTRGGPCYSTHLFGTYSFTLGIESGNVPRGAAVSLFMFPFLAIAAFFILFTKTNFLFWGELMAGALLAALPVVVMYSFLMDYYISGLTSGSLKQ